MNQLNYRQIIALMILLCFQNAFSQGNAPTAPEFSSFAGPGSGQLVDPFTGDFQYTIPVLEVPGPHGGGYVLNLSYRSGTGPQQEASWVGHGWSLNPGAITRSKRGYADDWNGVEVLNLNKIPSSETFTVYADAGLEAYGIGINGMLGFRFNTQSGGAPFYSVGGSLFGGLNANYSSDAGNRSFNISLDIWSGVSGISNMANRLNHNPSDGRKPQPSESGVRVKSPSLKVGTPAFFGSGEFARNVPSAFSRSYRGGGFGFKAAVAGDFTLVPVGISGGIFGQYEALDFIAEKKEAAFGFMYSAECTPAGAMDFYFENDHPYDYRQEKLPIPFSNADVFHAAGSGLGGSFRAHHVRTGSFRVPGGKGEVIPGKAAGQVHFGQNIGVGVTADVAYRSMTERAWSTSGADFADEGSLYERVFFKFQNDPGGAVLRGDNNDPIRAGIDAGPGLSGHALNPTNPLARLQVHHPTLSREVTDGLLRTEIGSNRRGTASIFFKTNRDILQQNHLAYTKGSWHDRHLDRNEAAIRDQIGEVVVFNNDGIRYQYSLPVYSRHEYNLEIGAESGQTVRSNHLMTIQDIVPQNDPDFIKGLMENDNLHTVTGRYQDAPYAAGWLLTSIVGADYVDVGNDGPTDDDLGGWTRFAYTQRHGSRRKSDPDGWYPWRQPYNGLLFNKNKLSNLLDDLGSVSGGEKEVYYLDSIVTQTHFALFIRKTRSDAHCPADFRKAAGSQTAVGSKTLDYLDRIELYVKNGNRPRLISTTHFQYDYAIFPGVPDNPQGGGRLTLRRIWTDNYDIKEPEISPLVFDYQYPDYRQAEFALPKDQRDKYADILSFREAVAGLETPAFSPFSMDRWGNYTNASAEETRRAALRPWVPQGDAEVDFDPAAWQLKRIVLPSRGELHVQYEPHDYEYVRDRKAMVMTRLQGNTDASAPQSKFFINTGDLGISDPGELEEYRKRLEKYFQGQGNKVFFRFLYAVQGSDPGIENSCSEYIEGMANLAATGIEGGKLFIELSGKNGNGDLIRPHDLCKDMAETGLVGGLSTNSSCGGGKPFSEDDEERIRQFFSSMADFFDTDDWCARINLSGSYLRLPAFRSKKGGGIRVKRLLEYDRGLEPLNSDAVLYGREFLYTRSDGSGSSGVVTHEPARGRMENPLMDLIPKDAQNMLDRMVGGRDIDQQIGFIGESILPAPSIGYASVIEKNIHHGLTAPGFIVHEFYTARDERFSCEKTSILTNKADYPSIAVGQNFVSKFNGLSATQGFAFVHTQLHGQKKQYSVYNGVLPASGYNPAATTLVSREEYRYFRDGDSIPVYSGPGLPPSTAPLGKEMEISLAGRTVREDVSGLVLSVEATIGLVAPFPVVHFVPLPGHKTITSILETHTTSKVISYPAVLQEVRTLSDGMKGGYQYLACDDQTGAPVLVRTTDAFDDLYLPGKNTAHEGDRLRLTLPAYPDYPAFTSKSEYEGRSSAVQASQLRRADSLELIPSGGGCGTYDYLIPGDLLYLNANSTSDDVLRFGGARGLYYVVDFTAKSLLLVAHSSNAQHRFTTNTDRNISFTIARTARNNRINATSTDISLYGQEWPEIDREGSYQAFLGFESMINTRLRGLSESAPVSVVKTVPGLQGRDPQTGECRTVSDVKQGVIVLRRMSAETIDISTEYGTQQVCRTPVPNTGTGILRVNPETGQVRYHLNSEDCIGIPIACLQFCDPQRYVMNQVISAAGQTFDDNWNHPEDRRFPAQSSTFEKGERSRWQARDRHNYRSAIRPGSEYGTPARIYAGAGTFDELPLYNHQLTLANDSLDWLRSTTTTAVNAHGEAVEMTDIMHRSQATRYGYGGLLPVVTAANARQDQLLFVSFESAVSGGISVPSGYTDYDGWALPNSNHALDGTRAHTGERSILLNGPLSLPYELVQGLKGEEVRVMVWVSFENESQVEAKKESLELHQNLTSNQVDKITLQHMARVDKWNLFSATFRGLDATNMMLVHQSGRGGAMKVWLDDFSIRPADAAVSALVYDRLTFRELARFSDQHFPAIFQYNAQGKLIRKIIETERGRKTVAETHYNLPKERRVSE